MTFLLKAMKATTGLLDGSLVLNVTCWSWRLCGRFEREVW